MKNYLSLHDDFVCRTRVIVSPIKLNCNVYVLPLLNQRLSKLLAKLLRFLMRIQSTSQTFSIDERSGDFNGRQHIDVAPFQVRQGDATCGIIINGLRTKLHILPTITTDQTKSGLI